MCGKNKRARRIFVNSVKTRHQSKSVKYNLEADQMQQREIEGDALKTDRMRKLCSAKKNGSSTKRKDRELKILEDALQSLDCEYLAPFYQSKQS